MDPNDPERASMVVSLPALPEGVYLVRWTAVAAVDGDLTGGVFTFGVAEGGVAPGQSPTIEILPPDEADNPATSQSPTSPAPPSDEGGGLPLALIAAVLGALLLAGVVGLVLFFRRARV